MGLPEMQRCIKAALLCMCPTNQVEELFKINGLIEFIENAEILCYGREVVTKKGLTLRFENLMHTTSDESKWTTVPTTLPMMRFLIQQAIRDEAMLEMSYAAFVKRAEEIFYADAQPETERGVKMRERMIALLSHLIPERCFANA